METEDLTHLDPNALAVARYQASVAGISLKDHLESLIRRSVGSAGHIVNQQYGYGPGVCEYSFDYGFQMPAFLPRGYQDHSPGAVAFAGQPVPSAFALPWGIPPSPYDASTAGHPADPALLQVSRFNTRVDCAATLLSAAFAEGAVTDFVPSRQPRHSRKPYGAASWYLDVVNHCIDRAHEVRDALVHRWEPTGRAERLALDAFGLLTELTPAGGDLVRICQYDRPRAFSEMAKHLDLVARQVELSVSLLVENDAGAGVGSTGDTQCSALADALLVKAGGGLSLTEAAALLNVSRQALHKRIKAGTVLGMMHGSELVLPRGQFQRASDRVTVLPGITEVLGQFSTAGNWSALQFLVEPDPNLSDTPLHALAAGRVDDVTHAAKAYLGLDET